MSPFIASCTRQGMHGFWPLDPALMAGQLGTSEFFHPGSSHCIAPSTGAPLWCMGADWPHGYLAAMGGSWFWREAPGQRSRREAAKVPEAHQRIPDL